MEERKKERRKTEVNGVKEEKEKKENKISKAYQEEKLNGGIMKKKIKVK